jgi:ribosome-binding factor A
METTRQHKVARLVQKELADIFLKIGRNLAPGVLITVTEVRISPDLSVAKTYISVFPTAKREKTLASVKNSVKEIRHTLGTKVKNQLRIVPELVFIIDDSLDRAERIDQLLKK